MRWLNCTRTRVNPADVAVVAEILASDVSLSPIRNALGFCELFLVESTEVPGEMISITIWESAEDGQAYLASPECREVIDALQGYLHGPLERHYYQVHIAESNQEERQIGGVREIL